VCSIVVGSRLKCSSIGKMNVVDSVIFIGLCICELIIGCILLSIMSTK